jgi:hypothetical protein
MCAHSAHHLHHSPAPTMSACLHGVHANTILHPRCAPAHCNNTTNTILCAVVCCTMAHRWTGAGRMRPTVRALRSGTASKRYAPAIWSKVVQRLNCDHGRCSYHTVQLFITGIRICCTDRNIMQHEKHGACVFSPVFRVAHLCMRTALLPCPRHSTSAVNDWAHRAVVK